MPKNLLLCIFIGFMTTVLQSSIMPTTVPGSGYSTYLAIRVSEERILRYLDNGLRPESAPSHPRNEMVLLIGPNAHKLTRDKPVRLHLMQGIKMSVSSHLPR
jgi:hypothetical protein